MKICLCLLVLTVLWLPVQAAALKADDVGISAAYHLQRGDNSTTIAPEQMRIHDVTCRNLSKAPLTLTLMRVQVTEVNGIAMPAQPVPDNTGVTVELTPEGVKTVEIDPVKWGYALVDGTTYLLETSWRVVSAAEVITLTRIFPYRLPGSTLTFSSAWMEGNGIRARAVVTVDRKEFLLAVEIANCSGKTLNFLTAPSSGFRFLREGRELNPVFIEPVNYVSPPPTPFTLPAGAVISLVTTRGAVIKEQNEYQLFKIPEIHIVPPGNYEFVVHIFTGIDGMKKLTLPPFTLLLPPIADRPVAP